MPELLLPHLMEQIVIGDLCWPLRCLVSILSCEMMAQQQQQEQKLGHCKITQCIVKICKPVLFILIFNLQF
jgi:hypothetical protein